MPADPISGRVTFTLRNRLDDLPLLQRNADQLLDDHHIEQKPAYALRLAIEELVSNVIRHGFEDTRIHHIGVTIEVRPASVDLTVEDDGRPFDPNTKGDPDTPVSLEETPTGGRGLALVREMAGPIQYSRAGARNRTTVRVFRDGRRYA